MGRMGMRCVANITQAKLPIGEFGLFAFQGKGVEITITYLGF